MAFLIGVRVECACQSGATSNLLSEMTVGLAGITDVVGTIQRLDKRIAAGRNAGGADARNFYGPKGETKAR